MTSVVCFHAGVPLVSGGFVGVDVFFVISGYLIGSIIHRGVCAGTFSFADFYARRSRRILPALFAMLLAAAGAALLMLAPAELARFGRTAVAAVAAASNVFLWQTTNYFTPAAELNPLLMTWSLGVEEQYYVLLPPVMLLARRLAPRRMGLAIGALCLASFAVSAVSTSTAPTAAFFLLPARIWELGAGTLLAIAEDSGWIGRARSIRLAADLAGVAGLSLLAVAVLSFDGATPFPGYAAILPVGATVLLVAADGGVINRRILASRPAVAIGRVSYSWYLWHWPMLSFARIAAGGPIPVRAALVVVLASLVAAVLSWRLVEQPFRRSRGPVRRTLLGYGAATLAAGAAAAAISANHGWPNRFDPVLAEAERQAAELAGHECLAGYGDTVPRIAEPCAPTTRGEAEVALLGDSHAAALAGALKEIAAQRGYALVELTKSSCPPLLGVTRRMRNHPNHAEECAAYDAQAFRMVVDDPRIAVVVLAGFWSAPFAEEDGGSRYVKSAPAAADVSPAESRGNLRAGLEEAIRVLRAAGKQVVVAQDVPVFDFDPFSRVKAASIPARGALCRLVAAPSDIGRESAGTIHVGRDGAEAAEIVAEVVSGYPDVTLLDLRKSFCSAERCDFADGPSLYFSDPQHLTLQGALRALRRSDPHSWLAAKPFQG